MAVPETGRDHHALAVKHGGIFGNLNRCTRPSRRNATAMDKDDATFNRDSRRRRINLRPHQSQILGAGHGARKQHPQQKGQGEREQQIAAVSHTA